MILVDVNLLIYAIDLDSPRHEKAHAWFESVLNGADWVCFSWIVILSFLRLTTRAGILRRPLPPEKAMDLCDQWIGLPPVQILVPGRNHWSIFKNLIRSVGTAGNLTSDTHLAALALENGCLLYSADNDFKRFPGIRHINPLD